MAWITQGAWVLAGVALIAWISVRLKRAQMDGGELPGATWHWDVVYVDDNGEMRLSTLRVLGVDAQTRRLKAWCSASGCERQLRLSRIARAQDLRTGRRVNLERWMASVAGKDKDAGAGRPARRWLGLSRAL